MRRPSTAHPSLDVVDGGGHQPASREGQEAGKKDTATELSNDPGANGYDRHEQDGHRVGDKA